MLRLNIRKFYGKYRGVVVDNKDPQLLERIRVKIPSIFGEQTSGWALPCVPYSSSKVGFFFIPPLGSNIWIEFEEGNLDSPIWVGCFWGKEELPVASGDPEVKMIKTDFVTITIDERPLHKKFLIEIGSGQKIIADESGIEFRNGSTFIKIRANSISSNSGPLETE